MAWSQLECEVIVADYLVMLTSELKGVSYSKAEHRRALLPKLVNRSEGSVEYKHQNISAILIELGYPYIAGYKPAFNYQQLLRKTVESSIGNTLLIQVADELIDQDNLVNLKFDWDSVLSDAPAYEQDDATSTVREFSPRQYNFTDRERQNRNLGEKGEAFVLELEKQRLMHAGRGDLIGDIEWTSKVKGDGSGYDIRSFNPLNDTELFIEVKTTKLGKYLPFYISENEVQFSCQYADQYSLYRVYEFRQAPKLFILEGDISQNVNLQPATYRAGFR